MIPFPWDVIPRDPAEGRRANPAADDMDVPRPPARYHSGFTEFPYELTRMGMRKPQTHQTLLSCGSPPSDWASEDIPRVTPGISRRRESHLLTPFISLESIPLTSIRGGILHSPTTGQCQRHRSRIMHFHPQRNTPLRMIQGQKRAVIAFLDSRPASRASVPRGGASHGERPRGHRTRTPIKIQLK